MGILRTFGRMLGFEPTAGQLREDIREMQGELKDMVATLIPLIGDELELLSLLEVKAQRKKGMIFKARGTYTSIYHEPMVTYAYRDYFKDGRSAILLVRTLERELLYRIKPKKILTYLHSQPLGVMTRDGLMYGGRRNRLICRLGKTENGLTPVISGDVELGSVVDYKSVDNIHPRAFQFLRKMDETQESLFLASALFHIIFTRLREGK